MSLDEILEKVKQDREAHEVEIGKKCWFKKCCGQKMVHVIVYLKHKRKAGFGVAEYEVFESWDEIVCLCCGRHYPSYVSELS